MSGGSGQLAHALAFIAELSGALISVSPFVDAGIKCINAEARRVLVHLLPEAACCLTQYDEVYLLVRQQLDICDAESIDAAFKQISPDVVINCAAYNRVDKAEIDVDAAYQVNAEGPRLLAEQCKKNAIKLIHISTDFVFSGDKNAVYDEQDIPSPTSVYGQSKLAGELAVLQTLGSHGYIVRTAWLYSVWQHNFVKTMQQLFGSKNEINVINSQRGSPTWCEPLAVVIFELAKVVASKYDQCAISNQTGSGSLSEHVSVSGNNIYHYAGNGHCSWFNFANNIQKLMKIPEQKTQCIIRPISTECWQKRHSIRLAPRPKNSALCSDKIVAELSIAQDSLIRAAWQKQLQVMLTVQALNVG